MPPQITVCFTPVDGTLATGDLASASQDIKGRLHILASDCHNTHNRLPGMSSAVAAVTELVGEEFASAMAKDNPAAVIKGESIPFRPGGVLPQEAKEVGLFLISNFDEFRIVGFCREAYAFDDSQSTTVVASIRHSPKRAEPFFALFAH